MRVTITPDADAMLSVNPTIKDYLVTTLQSQQFSAACFVERNGGDLYFRCPDTKHGVLCKPDGLGMGQINTLITMLKASAEA